MKNSLSNRIAAFVAKQLRKGAPSKRRGLNLRSGFLKKKNGTWRTDNG